MTSSDDGLWPIIKRNLTGPHWQRIESSLTAGGIPDVNGCWRGQEAWLELKSVRAGQKIKSFTALQAGWLLKRHAAGGRVWVLVRHRTDGGPRLGQPIDRILIYPGSWSRELIDIGINVEPFLHIPTNATEGWNLMIDYLFSMPYPSGRAALGPLNGA